MDILSKLLTLAGRGSGPCYEPEDAHATNPAAVFKGGAAAGEEVEITRGSCSCCKLKGSTAHEPLSPSASSFDCVLDVPVAGTPSITAKAAIAAWRSRQERCPGCGAVDAVEVTRHLVSAPPHLAVRFVAAASGIEPRWNATAQLPFKLSLDRSVEVPVSADGATTQKYRVVVVGKRASKKQKRMGGYSFGNKTPKPTGWDRGKDNPSFLVFVLDQDTRDYVMQDGPVPTPVTDGFALSSTDSMRVDWIIGSPVDPLAPDDDDATNDEFSAGEEFPDEGVSQWVGRWDKEQQLYVRFSNIGFKTASMLQVFVTPLDNVDGFDELLAVLKNAVKESRKRATTAGSAKPPAIGAPGPSVAVSAAADEPVAGGATRPASGAAGPSSAARPSKKDTRRRGERSGPSPGSSGGNNTTFNGDAGAGSAPPASTSAPSSLPLPVPPIRLLSTTTVAEFKDRLRGLGVAWGGAAKKPELHRLYRTFRLAVVAANKDGVAAAVARCGDKIVGSAVRELARRTAGGGEGGRASASEACPAAAAAKKPPPPLLPPGSVDENSGGIIFLGDDEGNENDNACAALDGGDSTHGVTAAEVEPADGGATRPSSGAAGPSAGVPAAKVKTAAGGAGRSKLRHVSMVSLENSHLAGRVRDVLLIVSKLGYVPRDQAIALAANLVDEPKGPGNASHAKGEAGLCHRKEDYTVDHLEKVGHEKGDLVKHLCEHPELVGKIWRDGEGVWPHGLACLLDTETQASGAGDAKADIPFTRIQGRPGLFRYLVESVLLYAPTGLRCRQIATLAYKLDLLRDPAANYKVAHLGIKRYISGEMWRKGEGVPFVAVRCRTRPNGTGHVAVVLYPRVTFPSSRLSHSDQADNVDLLNDREREEEPSADELAVCPAAVAAARAAPAVVAELLLAQTSLRDRTHLQPGEVTDEYDKDGEDEEGEEDEEEEDEPSTAAAAAARTTAMTGAAAAETAPASAAPLAPPFVRVPIRPFCEYNAFVAAASSLNSPPMTWEQLLRTAKAEIDAAGREVGAHETRILQDRAKLFQFKTSTAKFRRQLNDARQPLYHRGMDLSRLRDSTKLLLRGPDEKQPVEAPPEQDRNRFPAAAAAAAPRGCRVDLGACFWNAAVAKSKYDRCPAACGVLGASIVDAIGAFQGGCFPGLPNKFALVVIAEGGRCFSRENRRNVPWLVDEFHVYESPPVAGTGAGGRGIYVMADKAIFLQSGLSIEAATIDKSFVHVVIRRAGSPPVNLLGSHLPCKPWPKVLTLARSTGSLERELPEQGKNAVVLDTGDQNTNLKEASKGKSNSVRLFRVCVFVFLLFFRFFFSSSRFISFHFRCFSYFSLDRLDRVLVARRWAGGGRGNPPFTHHFLTHHFPPVFSSFSLSLPLPLRKNRLLCSPSAAGQARATKTASGRTLGRQFRGTPTSATTRRASRPRRAPR
jgi:hypothetical protein